MVQEEKKGVVQCRGGPGVPGSNVLEVLSTTNRPTVVLPRHVPLEAVTPQT